MLEIVYSKVSPCLQDAEAYLDMLLGDYVNVSRSRGGVTAHYGSAEDRDAAAQNVLNHVNELARIGILVTEVNVDYVRSNPENWRYLPGKVCKSCGIESGGDRPFYASNMCTTCQKIEQAYAKGMVCKSCGIESGGDSPFHTADICVACSNRGRAYTKGRVCKSCGIESGDSYFSTLDMCGSCLRMARAYAKGMVCKSCGIVSGDRPFGALDMCQACHGRERAYAKGMVCKSCGIESGGDRPFRSLDRCGTCSDRLIRFERKGWPSLCVAGIHTPPPPREIVYAEHVNSRLRDYPPCNCYIAETGQVVPDPEIRYIPETDQPDPSRGYSPLKERREAMGLGPKRRTRDFDPTGRKGSSNKSPRRSTRGGSPFDIGPRRP